MAYNGAEYRESIESFFEFVGMSTQSILSNSIVKQGQGEDVFVEINRELSAMFRAKAALILAGLNSEFKTTAKQAYRRGIRRIKY